MKISCVSQQQKEMTVTLNAPISDFTSEQLLARLSAFKITLYCEHNLNTVSVTNKL